MATFVLRERPKYITDTGESSYLIESAVQFTSFADAAEYLRTHPSTELQIVPHLHAYNQYLDTRRTIEYGTNF